MRDAVDLDEHVRVVDRGERAKRAPSDLEAVLVTSEPLDHDLDRRAVDRHAMAVGRDLRDDQAVGLPAMAKLDRVRESGAGLRTPAARERVEACPLGGGRPVRDGDRGLDQRDVGVAYRHDLTAQLQAVEPCRVDVARADLRAIQQLEQKALVGGTTVDDHRRVRQRAAQAREGFVAIAARRDELGDGRVKRGGDDVPFGDAGVDAHAGTGGQAQQRDPAWRGYEIQRRVFRVQARLDRMAPPRRRLAFQPAAGRDVELELDEVEAGDRLGDGVLGLQRRVDLHEREGLGRRLVEKLDRGSVAAAGAQRNATRRVEDLALLLGRERRARRLLDDLLAVALVRAVAQADRPRVAVAVGDDLRVHVARRRHELLEQHGAVAEGVLGLGPRGGERGREGFGLVDAADAAPAAPRRRFDDEREADARGVPERRVDGLDGTAAPRRHRHAGFLGEPLGGDLVTNQPDDRRVRPDEDDAESLAPFGKLGLLRDEAPPDPDRIGARRAQGARQRVVVEVPPVERDRLVRMADEHRVALGLRVERDDTYRLGAFHVDLAHGVDDANRGFAAVDDRQARERALHSSVSTRSGRLLIGSLPPMSCGELRPRVGAPSRGAGRARRSARR
jgi:hypothetical protein